MLLPQKVKGDVDAYHQMSWHIDWKCGMVLRNEVDTEASDAW